jgi:p-cymene monooxygenase electron transfer component
MSWFTALLKKAPTQTVLLTPSHIEIAVESGETILERALKNGMAFPHDCTVGTCGTCRCRLLDGKVDAITPFSYTLSAEELKAGYILACQAIPKSSLQVEVELGAAGEIVPEPRDAKLIEMVDLTHDIKLIRWELTSPLRYKAGQYVNVRWNHSDKYRSYSFATGPLPGGRAKVSSFVRHVPGGEFTDLLFKGDPFKAVFELHGPHGNFWLRKAKVPIICIAGGSGLAPILSLLEDAVRRRVRRDCVLLFGARTERDLYAVEEISRIRDGWTASFDYWPVLSEEDTDRIRHGLVTEFIPFALQKLGADAQGYLCGPPGMIDAGINVLVAQGMALDDIYYDKFTDSSTRA